MTAGVRFVVGLALRVDRRRLLTAGALMLAGYLATPFIGVSLKVFTDSVIAGRVGWATAVAIGAAALLVCELVLAHFAHLYYFELGDLAGTAVDAELIGIVNGTAGLAHLDDPSFADTVALVRQDAARMRASIEAVLTLGALAVQATVTTVVLVIVYPWLALLPAVAVVPVLLSRRAQGLVDRAKEATAAQTRLAGHLLELATSPTAIQEVRLSGAEGYLGCRYAQAWSTATGALWRAHLRGAALRSTGQLLFALGYGTAILLVVRRAAAGTATVGDAVLVVALAVQISVQVAGALGLLATVQSAGRTASRLAELRVRAKGGQVQPIPAREPHSARLAGGPHTPDEPNPARGPHTPDGPVPAGGPHAPGEPIPARGPHPPDGPVAAGGPRRVAAMPVRLHTGIRLDGVGFAYSGAAAPVLDGVDLDLPAGSTVAIVGDNGAGKSTLVKLLCGLYEPTGGQITVDGVDLRDLPPDGWRGGIAMLFQDFARLELLVRENVGVGDLPRLADDAALAKAVAAAGADNAVRSVHGGLDGIVGHAYGDGTELSGGQWQSLGLARALMRTEPLLLALDEPAAALDATAEHALFARFAAMPRAAGAITVFVSHRFSTVPMADLIVVLDGGRIVARGSHAELVARGGLYADLFALAARAYG